MKLIINSDDFGFSKKINDGIIYAFYEGLISTTSVMVSLDNAKDAIIKWKENEKEIKEKNPQDEIGLALHLNITKEKSVLGLPSLCDENGEFKKVTDFENHEYIMQDVLKEFRAQVELLKSYDVQIDHIDCHHAICKSKVIREALIILAKENDLPLRSEHPLLTSLYRGHGIKTCDMFFHGFSKDGAKAENLKDFINKNSKLESLEIMTHLGFMDEDTKRRTTYINREDEINELKKLKQEGFFKDKKLYNFRSI